MLYSILFHGRSIVKETLRGKFKAMLRYAYDPTYRRDINYMCRVLSRNRWTATDAELPLYSIRFSHAINYPRWVDELCGRMYDTLWYPKPIKVVYDWKRDDGTYLVVDGNHRLMAWKRMYSPGRLIRVILLVPRDDG